MRKITTTTFFLIVILNAGYTQDVNTKNQRTEDLLHSLDTARQDTTRVLVMAELANTYKSDIPDSALFYGYKALALARQIQFPIGEVRALGYVIIALNTLGNDSKALEMALQGLKIAEKNNLIESKASLLAMLGNFYNGVKNHTKALDLLRASKALLDSLHDFPQSAFTQRAIGETYLMLNQPDSALYYCKSAYENAVQLKDDWPVSYILFSLGRIEDKKGSMDLALAYFRQSLSIAWNTEIIFRSYLSIAQLYQQKNKQDSCIYYANKSLEAVKGTELYSYLIKANILLSDIYEKSDPQKAVQYSKTAIAYKDSLDNLGKGTSFENLIAFDEQERQYEIETANATYRNRITQYVLIAGLLVFLFIVFILYRNNRNKEKAKVKIESAYQNLKSTQAQLVQREKMASLGELTAGIAHEIQNPLNFVNNFSEVNTELIDDMENEMDKGNFDDAKAIAKDIKENEHKINHHGKRADAIVKGMLQHSRSSSAQKQETNINALADEYLRLAYHGLRAKDSSFAVFLQKDFDEGITKINVAPQNIGRALLNLYNNAFYVVTEKKKLRGESYEPVVSVSTKKLSNKIEIRVKDNGSGIPPNVIDKIFQPFFTTKPTGDGTGLGLSLAYDIITKEHNGSIKVESKEGEETVFIIQLPIS